MNYIKDIPLYNRDKNETLNVIVEVLQGSIDKNELTPPYFNSLTTVRHISLFYPFYYGSFPQTLAEDNDPLDMILFTDKEHKLLDVVRVDVIGAIKTTDVGDQDDKIICVESDCGLISLKKELKTALKFLKIYKGKDSGMKISKKLASMGEAFTLIENAHLNWRNSPYSKIIAPTSSVKVPGMENLKIIRG